MQTMNVQVSKHLAVGGFHLAVLYIVKRPLTMSYFSFSHMRERKCGKIMAICKGKKIHCVVFVECTHYYYYFRVEIYVRNVNTLFIHSCRRHLAASCSFYRLFMIFLYAFGWERVCVILMVLGDGWRSHKWISTTLIVVIVVVIADDVLFGGFFSLPSKP